MVTKRNAVALPPLLGKLIQLQKDSGLSDYKFARLLKIGRVVWFYTRKQQRPIGITLLKAIVQTYPELHPDVLDYLRGENHDDSNKAE